MVQGGAMLAVWRFLSAYAVDYDMWIAAIPVNEHR